MLTALRETKDPVAANFVAWTCALAPAAVSDWSAPLALARQAVAAQPDSLQNQNTLGTLLMRAGKLDEAIAVLDAVATRSSRDSAAANSPPVYTWYALALTQQAAGHAELARTWYERAKTETAKLLSEPPAAGAPLAWNRRLTLQLLQREAESKIAGASSPAMTGSPADH
jgi:tetratricopeptide (TPR) repeat protein